MFCNVQDPIPWCCMPLPFSCAKYTLKSHVFWKELLLNAWLFPHMQILTKLGAY